MRPRFTIRTLLILTALLAAACYWWIAPPTNMAKRFAQAAETRDYATAEAMAAASQSQTSLHLKFNTLAMLQNAAKAPGDTANARASGPSVEVAILPRDWRDIVRRERRLVMRITGDNDSISITLGMAPTPFLASLVALSGSIEYQTVNVTWPQ